jgi:tetratricopeptide (TPR) repeat protein
LLFGPGSSWSLERPREARREFEKAISIDPTNARAYSGLSDALGLDWDMSGGEDAWVALRRAHTARAIELEPELAEAHCSLAMILEHDWRFREAEREFKQALSLNPSYAFAHHKYGGLLAEEGRPDEALQEMIRAEELDPHSAINIQLKAGLLIMLRRLDEAEAALDRMRELREYEPVSDFRYHAWLAWLYNAKLDIPRALQEIARVYELRQFSEEGPTSYLVEVGMHSALAGDKITALENLEALKRTDTFSRFIPMPGWRTV